jgi:hypothetical protein
VKEFTERNKAKVEAFGTLEILPRQEESARISGGAALAVRSVGEQIWTIDFYVQGSSRGRTQKEETDSRWISLENPVSRWIGRISTKFNL